MMTFSEYMEKNLDESAWGNIKAGLSGAWQAGKQIGGGLMQGAGAVTQATGRGLTAAGNYVAGDQAANPMEADAQAIEAMLPRLKHPKVIKAVQSFLASIRQSAQRDRTATMPG